MGGFLDFLSQHFGALLQGALRAAGDMGTGAAIGATIGSIFPGIGTAIGAGIGSVIGGLGGAVYETYDTATKIIDSSGEPTLLDLAISAAGSVGGVAGGVGAQALSRSLSVAQKALQAERLLQDSHSIGVMNKAAPALGVHPWLAATMLDGASKAVLGKLPRRADMVMRPFLIDSALGYSAVAFGALPLERRGGSAPPLLAADSENRVYGGGAIGSSF